MIVHQRNADACFLPDCNCSGDFGDFASFVAHMKELALVSFFFVLFSLLQLL